MYVDLYTHNGANTENVPGSKLIMFRYRLTSSTILLSRDNLKRRT